MTVDIALANEVINGVVHDVNAIIEDVLQPAAELYYNGEDDESPLKDDQYDFIVRVAKAQAPAHPFFTGVGADVRGGKIDLPFQLGSIDQVEIGDVSKWKVACDLKSTDKIVVSAKLDGSSGAIILNQDASLRIAYSRGNGYQGADITRHLKHTIRNNTAALSAESVAIRGENIITVDNFVTQVQPKYTRGGGKPYLNPRNAVSGMMNAASNDVGVYKYIDFVAYERMDRRDMDKDVQLKELESMGFIVPKYWVINAEQLTDDYLTACIEDLRATYPYEIDGVVVEVNCSNKRAGLSPDSLNPGYSMKYKTTGDDNYVETEVVEVEWNPSKTSYGKPRVILKPAKLPGITWTHATGYNAKWIVDNGIGPGAIVGGSRMGDVVPNITKVVKSVKAQMPPAGSYEWNDTGVDIIMTGDEILSTVLTRQLSECCRSLDIDGLRDGVAKVLVEYTEAETFNELFKTLVTWPKSWWVDVIGANGAKIYDELNTKLKNIELSVWLGSMPHFGRGVGKRKMKALLTDLDVKTIDEFNALTVEQMCTAEKFKIKTAAKVVAGMGSHMELYDSVKQHIAFTQEDVVSGGKFTGHKVVMTGFRDAGLAKLIEQEGGEIQSGVSGKTTIVIAMSTSGSSSKLQKVRDMIAAGKQVELIDLASFKSKYLETKPKGIEF